jgi:hypothetical protein
MLKCKPEETPMKIKAIGQWSSEVIGNITDGQVLEVDPFLAEQFIQRGYAVAVEGYETKVVRETPKVGSVPLASGLDSDASLSPAAPASPEKTAKKSKAKKQS